MSEKLSVELSGDAKELQKATSDAVKSLKNFEKVADKSVGGIDKPTAKASKALGNLGKSSANATPSLQEFSRVIQDAPYGIQGVGNNITQLVSQFGYLQKSAGGTKAALKLMLSSLAGPAGILFAVSTAVSLLTVFSGSLSSTKSEAEKLAEATKKAAEKLESYADSLEQVSRARLRGEQSAQKELLTLSQLANAAEDTTRSTQDRAKAVQELRRLYPDYFKDLKDEEILTGDLKGVYDQLTDSILKRARATAATNQIVKNSEKQLVIESQLAAKQVEYNKALKDRAYFQKQQLQNRSGGVSFGAIQSEFNVDDVRDEINSLQGQLQNLELSNIDLLDLIDTSGGVDLSDVKLKEGTSKIELPVVTKLDLQIPSEGLSNSFSGLSTVIGEQIDNAVNSIDVGAARLKIALNELNDGISQTISGGIADTFNQLGASIGEALSTGGNVIESVGKGLLSSLGGILVELGKQAIAVGVGLIGVKLALKSLNPAAAIAAGVALVAIGGAFSSAASSTANSIGGSGGGGSSSRGGSSSSTSFTSGSGGGFDGGRVVFEISGQKLIGVLDRTRSRNLAIGG